jgi:hypothetical protein
MMIFPAIRRRKGFESSCPASRSSGGALCGGEIVAFARDRFSRFWRSLDQARRLGGAQESPGKAPGVPGTPQEQLRNEQREI